jgi:hypothetical protein
MSSAMINMMLGFVDSGVGEQEKITNSEKINRARYFILF